MRWIWRKLGLVKLVKDLVRDIVLNSMVYELKREHFYLIVLPGELLTNAQVDQIQKFLESHDVECLLAAADRVQLVELGD
jgi:hypothetical protein